MYSESLNFKKGNERVGNILEIISTIYTQKIWRVESYFIQLCISLQKKKYFLKINI